MTNYMDVIYAKNEVKLSWLIKLSPVCHENQTGQ